MQKLVGPIADAALAHDRPVAGRCDDSVLRLVGGCRQLLRRARGFVPEPIRIAPDSVALLATGAEMKNTFCLVSRGEAFVSQHIGELRDYPSYRFYQEEIGRWQKLLRVRPELVVHDLHPAYLSSRYAGRLEGARPMAVQHHHAHVASVLAEHGLQGPVLGVALDGTGYGPDGTVWGGEFLLADRLGFERLAHFKTYPMPGGERAIEEPWRMAASLCRAEGISWPDGRSAFAPAWWRDGRGEAIEMLIASEVNCPPTSSAGRLFDAVASLLGLCDAAGYEAQGAIRLEAAVDRTVADHYPYTIIREQMPWTLNFGSTLRAVVEDCASGTDKGIVSARFHNTIAAAVTVAARELCAARNLLDVALSGGVFQNRFLFERMVQELSGAGFKVYVNSLVPPNDGGISLGQAAIAVAREGAICA